MNRKRDALVSELRAHNSTLREQLEAERQGHTETRRLIAAALERVPPQPEAGARTVQTNQDGEENLFKPSKAAFLSLLRGAARDKAAYDNPLMRVLLPTYLLGFVVVCLIASIGAYAALNPKDPVLSRATWAFPFVSWGFGVYAGLRDGARYRFRMFHIAGLITAVGATVFVAGVSVMAQKGHSFDELLTLRNVLAMLGSLITTYFLIIFGAVFAQALAKAADSDTARQEGQATQSNRESGTGMQAWVGLIGSIITALASLLGVLVQTLTGAGT